MRYFHRTSARPDAVLREADRFLGARLAAEEAGQRHRVFSGPVGRIAVTVEAEGGHYTLVRVATDQVGESEADKVAKRFLAVVHKLVDREYEVRGAY